MQLVVRAWKEEDAFALYQMSVHPFYLRKRIWRYLYPDTFLKAMSMIHFYQHADSSRFLFRAIEYKHKVCGFIQCEKKTSSNAELTYWLDVSYWNQGIMKESVRLFCKEAFEVLPIYSIYARVDKRNEASCHVLLHNGFTKETLDSIYVFRKCK